MGNYFIIWRGKAGNCLLLTLALLLALAHTGAAASYPFRPAGAPSITGFAPGAGSPGSTIVLTGSGFAGASAVTVNGSPVASFIVQSDTQLSLVLSATQTSGLIAVTTPDGTAGSGGSLRVGPLLVVVRGNSQANGATANGNTSPIGSNTTGAWPDQARQLLDTTAYAWFNRSHNGATIDYLRQSDSTEVAPLFATNQYGEQWIVLQETTNQIFRYGSTAQGVYAKMVAWAQYWHAHGVQVAVVTCYPTQDQQYDAEIDAINALYRANWASFCDMLLDVASSPYLTPLGMDPQYGYSSDGLHLNEKGNQIPAHCVAQGFGAVQRAGVVPATYVLPGIAAPTVFPPSPGMLRLRYGTTSADYVIDSTGTIQRRIDRSGNGLHATITTGHAGPQRVSYSGRQVAQFAPAAARPSQSLTVADGLVADSDVTLVMDLRLLAGGANSAISVGGDFSIWFQNTTQLQVYSGGTSFTSPLNFDGSGLTRCIFTFNASTREMVLYAHNAEVYRTTLPELPWLGSAPELDLELGGYQNGNNPLSGEMGAVAVYNSLLGEADRTTWFSSAAEAPLPVELATFTATAANGGTSAQLAWTTASELNSAHFEVERSLDGVAYASIGQVAAAGSSNSTRTYQFADRQPLTGASPAYYRLRLVDADGAADYSPVRAVALVPLVVRPALALFPNPASGTTTVQNAEPGSRVQLLNTVGSVVATAAADAAGTAQLTLPAGLAGGLYLVRAGGRTVRLVVQP